MAIGFEQLQYGINMATAIRLSPTQLPKLYNHLPPICKRLGIEELKELNAYIWIMTVG